jgi:hypothetical protein
MNAIMHILAHVSNFSGRGSAFRELLQRTAV